MQTENHSTPDKPRFLINQNLHNLHKNIYRSGSLSNAYAIQSGHLKKRGNRFHFLFKKTYLSPYPYYKGSLTLTPSFLKGDEGGLPKVHFLTFLRKEPK
jgi:hypothetical protein